MGSKWFVILDPADRPHPSFNIQPTVCWKTFKEAKDEAKRLSFANPGKRFHVCRVMGTAQASVVVGWDDD